MVAKGKFRELVKLSKEGIACDQCNLGVAYALGDGTAKNLEKALKWYSLAAEQGDNRAVHIVQWLTGRL